MLVFSVKEYGPDLVDGPYQLTYFGSRNAAIAYVEELRKDLVDSLIHEYDSYRDAWEQAKLMIPDPKRHKVPLNHKKQFVTYLNNKGKPATLPDL